MQEPDLFLIFIQRLNRMDARYMVTGSVASTAYGEPRLTHDVDLVLEIGRLQIGRLCEAFPLSDFYCPPEEVIAEESRRPNHGHFNIIHHETGYKADCYLAGNDPLHQWGMIRRRKIDMNGEPFYLAPPEYVIIRKLEYFKEGGSEKHLRDIRNMLEVSADLVDLSEIAIKVGEKNLEKEWAKARELITDSEI